MHPAIKAVKQGLAYAKFESAEIKHATYRLLDDIGVDLDSTNMDYEQPTHIDEDIVALEKEISDFDSAQEAIKDVIDKSKSEPTSEVED